MNTKEIWKNNKSNYDIYDCIVIGAGAAGLFYAAAEGSLTATAPGKSAGNSGAARNLVLEKTARPGQKLLMSGSGMCNITHGGSIKDFISKYGEHGKKIRTCLYRHNNLELMRFIKSLGVPLTERADGKVFPASMKAADVLNALLAKASEGGWDLQCNAAVSAIDIASSDAADNQIRLQLADGRKFITRKLVIATGGASYPATGSDGSFFHVMKRDLGVSLVEPKPALAPIYVQNYPYTNIAGISFEDVEVTCGRHTSRGPLLLTHKGFSGPAVLHLSQYVKPGAIMKINFLPSENIVSVFQKLRQDQIGNSKGIANYIASEFGLPKAFAQTMFAQPGRKLSSVGHKELENVAHLLMERGFTVSGTGGWKEAMVTAGGVDLEQIDLKSMQLKASVFQDAPSKTPAPDIRIIGEALDINGDTGGYNLQFAYSSAMAAIFPIPREP